jgi:hypothetical protein
VFQSPSIFIFLPCLSIPVVLPKHTFY